MCKEHIEAMKADARKMHSAFDKMKANVASISNADEKARWQANIDMWQSMLDHHGQMLKHMEDAQAKGMGCGMMMGGMGMGSRMSPIETGPDWTQRNQAAVAGSRTLGLMLRPTGRGLSRSGKAARTGRAAAPGSERGKLALNLVGVTIRALQVKASASFMRRSISNTLAAAAALVFIKGHHELLVLANGR